MPPVSPDRISLPDRYRVIRHLANGGMASVWEAHDELLDRAVAVKLLASHLGEDDRARRRFQREARAAAGLSSHPNVVTIYDVGEHQRRVFMVMEIMRGGSIGDALKSGRELPLKLKLRWLREAGAALDTAHDMGVVHRDIKPGNLLLDEHDRLGVADFGIARVAWEDQLTATGQVLGTAAYLSPEQALGEAAQPASDRYALAVVAYELLTGSRPFEADHFAAQARAHVEDPVPPASTRAPELSRAVDAVLERGLAKTPEDRWESAAAFVDALDRTLTEDTAPTRPTRKLGRREKRAAAGGLAAGAGAAGAAAAREPDTAEYGAPAARAGGDGADRPGNGRGGREPWAADGPSGRGGRESWAADDGRGRGAPPHTRGAAPDPEPHRSGGGPLIAALVALVLLAGAGVFVLATRGDDEPTQRAQSTPTSEPTRESTPEPTPEETETATPEPTETATPEPTDTPTPEPTPEETPDAPQGEPDLDAATKAQLEGYNARRAGDFQTALAKAQEAQRLCAGSKELSPCGYALFEEGAALIGLGQPEAAIPILERRLNEFGDNESGEVRKALRDAKKAARETAAPTGAGPAAAAAVRGPGKARKPHAKARGRER